MSTKRPRARPPLMVSVWAEIGAGAVFEGPLRHKTHFIDGACVGRTIIIDPSYQVVRSLVHEALHRLYAEWPENYVRRTTSWVVHRMTADEISRLYEEYQRRKKVRKTRLTLE